MVNRPSTDPPVPWRRVEALLAETLDLPAPERQAFIDAACEGQTALRDELMSLVTAAAQPAAIDDSPAVLGQWLDDLEGPSPPALGPGQSLGPYTITAQIGAGGTGEVYRARDTRLDRDVAIKVLSADAAGDAAARQRLEREARTVASLSHTNIVALYDIGTHEGMVYLVTELLDGRTLRDALRDGPLEERDVVDFGIQVATALSAAHARHIVHRDLKPDNLFVTRDRRVKVLDFGIAKLQMPAAGPPLTAAHAVIGTVDYMSPEQLTGDAVDGRTDLFALGAVLYEAASGRRPFQGNNRAEIASAILTAEPAPLGAPRTSPALWRTIARCLAKAPESRYQSAADLAFTLQLLGRNVDAEPASGPSPAARRPSPAWPMRVALASALVAALLAASYLAMPERPSSSPVVPRQLTFRQGHIGTAGFTPDGQVVVYGAAWDGEPYRLFTTRLDSFQSRPIDELPPADLLGLSRTSTMMAISMGRPAVDGFLPRGLLAQVDLSGGAPRVEQDGVVAVDYGPGGDLAAIVRRVDGQSQLEFPPGTVVHRANIISRPRVSSDGTRVCFSAIYGELLHAERGRPAEVLATGVSRVSNCAWSPDGEEIWFSYSPTGSTHTSLEAMKRDGTGRRVLMPLTAWGILQAVRPDGLTLLTVGTLRNSVQGSPAPGDRERDLSVFDATQLDHLNAAGTHLLLFDNSTGARDGRRFLRPMDGSPPVSLGNAVPLALTPDGTTVAVLGDGTTGVNVSNQLTLMPIGAGRARTIRLPVEIQHSSGNQLGTNTPQFRTADFSDDGRRLLIPFAREPGGAPRVYVHDFGEEWTRPITPEGVTGPAVLSPDGRFVASNQGEGLFVYDVDTRERRSVPGGPDPGLLARWSSKGEHVYLFDQEGASARLVERHLRTGARRVVREIRAADPAGVSRFDPWVSRTGSAYAYSLNRRTTNLFVLEGLR